MAAFETVAESPEDIEERVRTVLKAKIEETQLLKCMPRDLMALFA